MVKIGTSNKEPLFVKADAAPLHLLSQKGALYFVGAL